MRAAGGGAEPGLTSQVVKGLETAATFPYAGGYESTGGASASSARPLTGAGERWPTLMPEASPRVIEQSESALVTAAKAGDYDAFEQLVNRYEHKIYRLGLNITGNPEDAEDVLQEAFLKAFENLPRFREDSRFYTWIVRIAVNQALMKLRKRRTDKSVSLDDPIEEDGEVIPRDFADWKPNPEQLLGRTETRETLEKAIQNLSPSFRTVFMLRDVEGLSTEETAEMLGLTISAVKARLFRARLRLREELSQVFKER